MIDENVNCMSITQSAAYVDKIVPEHNMVVAAARHGKLFVTCIFRRQAMRNRLFFTRMSRGSLRGSRFVALRGGFSFRQDMRQIESARKTGTMDAQWT